MITLKENATRDLVGRAGRIIAATERVGAWVAKAVAVALTALLIAATAIVAAAPSASAAYGCSSSTYPVLGHNRGYKDHSGIDAAESISWYNQDISGKRCDHLVAENQYYGMYKYMRLKTCSEQSLNCKIDAGYFYYYAGPNKHNPPATWCHRREDHMRNSSGLTIMNIGYSGWPC